jgi:hypothetical protein
MAILSRSQAVDQVALDPVHGKVDEVAVEAVGAVGVVAPVAVETERNQLVCLARRKERPALEQAMAVQIQDPFSVQTELEACQGVVQEAESDSCRHDKNPLSDMTFLFCVLTFENLLLSGRNGRGVSQVDGR